MKKALVVVDFQRDFLDQPGAALPVPGATARLPRINHLIMRARGYQYPTAFTRCWHPPDHISFADRGGKFPRHCVAWTQGADYAEGLETMRLLGLPVRHFSKGRDSGVEQFSACEVGLSEWLLSYDVRIVTVCGVATEYCVYSTATDLQIFGFDVEVDEFAIAGLERHEEAKVWLHKRGIRIGDVKA